MKQTRLFNTVLENLLRNHENKSYRTTHIKRMDIKGTILAIGLRRIKKGRNEILLANVKSEENPKLSVKESDEAGTESEMQGNLM